MSKNLDAIEKQLNDAGIPDAFNDYGQLTNVQVRVDWMIWRVKALEAALGVVRNTIERTPPISVSEARFAKALENVGDIIPHGEQRPAGEERE